jgi:hypothetical protein
MMALKGYTDNGEGGNARTAWNRAPRVKKILEGGALDGKYLIIANGKRSSKAAAPNGAAFNSASNRSLTDGTSIKPLGSTLRAPAM